MNLYLRFAIAILSVLPVAVGCQQEKPQLSEISVQPLMGGLGGMTVQVVSPETGVVSVYHLPPNALDSDRDSNLTVDLPLLLRANLNDAGDSLPVTIGRIDRDLPAQSVSSRRSNSPDRKAPVAKETVTEKIVEVEKLIPKEVDVLRPIDVTKISNGFLISDGDLEVGDDYIQDIRFTASSIEGRMEAAVMLKNNTDAEWMPNVDFTILNKYGIKIGNSGIHWILDRIAPEQRKQEDVDFSVITHEGLFKYSHLGPVEDFDEPYCVIITYTKR